MKRLMKLTTLPNLLLISISLLLPSQVCGVEDWLEKGVSGLKTQHIEKAIEAFSRAITMHPDHVEAYNNRGVARCKKGDYDRAVADFNRALEIDPRSAEVYNNRGGVWFYKGKYDLAVNDYDKALGIDPNFAKAYSNRGAAWFCKGNRDLAIEDYNRALEINPNNAETNKQLAWIRSVYSGNAKRGDSKAAVLSQKDIRQNPKVASVTLAAPFAEQGKRPIEPLKEAGPAVIPKDNVDRVKKSPHETDADKSPHHNLTGAPDAPSKTGYSIQVGAFGSRENAETLTKRLKGRGYAARLLPIESWSKGVLYTVRIGEYATRREAKEKAADFSDKEKLPSTVRPANEL